MPFPVALLVQPHPASTQTQQLGKASTFPSTLQKENQTEGIHSKIATSVYPNFKGDGFFCLLGAAETYKELRR